MNTRLKVTPYYKDIMCRMREAGLTYREIKEYLFKVYDFSVSRRTVLYHTNDEWREMALKKERDVWAARVKNDD